MPAITTVADLPFPEVEPLTLLGFRPGEREGPDLDYDGFGHAQVPALELEGWAYGNSVSVPTVPISPVSPASPTTKTKTISIKNPRVFALHSVEAAASGPPPVDDIDLEFWLDDDQAIVVGLGLFLARRALDLIRRAGDSALVLALCNPHHARIARPPGLEVPLYYADGDVIAYLDVAEGLRPPWSIDQVKIRLVAERWHRV